MVAFLQSHSFTPPQGNLWIKPWRITNFWFNTFFCLSYDRFRACSKMSSPQSAIYCFLFRFTIVSLFLKLFQYLLTSSSSSSCHFFPSVTCLKRQFLRKIWPFQLPFLLFTVWRLFLSSMTLWNTFSFLTWSVQVIFPILLQHHI